MEVIACRIRDLGIQNSVRDDTDHFNDHVGPVEGLAPRKINKETPSKDFGAMLSDEISVYVSLSMLSLYSFGESTVTSRHEKSVVRIYLCES